MSEIKQIVGVYLCGEEYCKLPAQHLAVPVTNESVHSFDSESFRRNVIQTYCREVNNCLCKDVKDPM